MTDHGCRVPHLDGTETPLNLHERCEQVAVPNFNWFTDSIVAMVDGLIHLGPRDDKPVTNGTDAG